MLSWLRGLAGGMALLLLVVGQMACSVAPDVPPDTTARRWMEAGMAGDVETLVALSCDNYKAVARQVGEVSARNGGRQAGAGEAARDTLAELQFRVVLNDGQHALVRTSYLDSGLPLVREQGGWRVCPATGPTA
jgi:hypothetical protein